MLVLQRKAGDGIIINNDIEISIIEVSKDKVKIGIKAPKDVKILRKEIVQIKEQNTEAFNNVSYDTLKSFAKKFTEGIGNGNGK